MTTEEVGIVGCVQYVQETQLSLTNRATHLCIMYNGVADPKTRASPYVLPG